MSAKDEYIITEMFEEKVAEYTGAPYAVAIDSCSNAIFLALMCVGVQGVEITIPSKTYMSIPCEIIHAGGKVSFYDYEWHGIYPLHPTPVYDAALRFTADMYLKDTFMCLSFTGPSKRLKLGKGGMILTDNKTAYEWFKRARMSGRREKPYMEDNFDMIGWNFYMLPELATMGYRLMRNFYKDGKPLSFEDIEGVYSDLSKFKVYTK
ncbi:MAG: DegT/DnrJ/EryC1/StrS family aminotransferase [Novosphingobium sp.]|nr:DegT/DnrJ/EryC1/StrS family aminotransferase [Novosphingobium sp.]